MTSYATQMQMAQIAEQIQVVQLAIEEVRQQMVLQMIILQKQIREEFL